MARNTDNRLGNDLRDRSYSSKNSSIGHVAKPSLKYFDDKATVIQKLFRGHLGRKKAARLQLLVEREKIRTRERNRENKNRATNRTSSNPVNPISDHNSFTSNHNNDSVVFSEAVPVFSARQLRENQGHSKSEPLSNNAPNVKFSIPISPFYGVKKSIVPKSNPTIPYGSIEDQSSSEWNSPRLDQINIPIFSAAPTKQLRSPIRKSNDTSSSGISASHNQNARKSNDVGVLFQGKYAIADEEDDISLQDSLQFPSSVEKAMEMKIDSRVMSPSSPIRKSVVEEISPPSSPRNFRQIVNENRKSKSFSVGNLGGVVDVSDRVESIDDDIIREVLPPEAILSGNSLKKSLSFAGRSTSFRYADDDSLDDLYDNQADFVNEHSNVHGDDDPALDEQELQLWEERDLENEVFSGQNDNDDLEDSLEAMTNRSLPLPTTSSKIWPSQESWNDDLEDSLSILRHSVVPNSAPTLSRTQLESTNSTARVAAPPVIVQKNDDDVDGTKGLPSKKTLKELVDNDDDDVKVEKSNASRLGPPPSVNLPNKGGVTPLITGAGSYLQAWESPAIVNNRPSGVGKPRLGSAGPSPLKSGDDDAKSVQSYGANAPPSSSFISAQKQQEMLELQRQQQQMEKAKKLYDLQVFQNMPRQRVLQAQQRRNQAAIDIQRIFRGFRGRKVALLRRQKMLARFQCKNCGRVEQKGVYCKGCGHRKPSVRNATPDSYAARAVSAAESDVAGPKRKDNVVNNVNNANNKVVNNNVHHGGGLPSSKAPSKIASQSPRGVIQPSNQSKMNGGGNPPPSKSRIPTTNQMSNIPEKARNSNNSHNSNHNIGNNLGNNNNYKKELNMPGNSVAKQTNNNNNVVDNRNVANLNASWKQAQEERLLMAELEELDRRQQQKMQEIKMMMKESPIKGQELEKKGKYENKSPNYNPNVDIDRKNSGVNGIISSNNNNRNSEGKNNNNPSSKNEEKHVSNQRNKVPENKINNDAQNEENKKKMKEKLAFKPGARDVPKEQRSTSVSSKAKKVAEVDSLAMKGMDRGDNLYQPSPAKPVIAVPEKSKNVADRLGQPFVGQDGPKVEYNDVDNDGYLVGFEKKKRSHSNKKNRPSRPRGLDMLDEELEVQSEGVPSSNNNINNKNNNNNNNRAAAKLIGERGGRGNGRSPRAGYDLQSVEQEVQSLPPISAEPSSYLSKDVRRNGMQPRHIDDDELSFPPPVRVSHDYGRPQGNMRR